MMRLTETVKHLILINVLVFFAIAGLVQAGVTIPRLEIYFPTSQYFRPYQLVTSIFSHADFSHLFFNMLMLFFMGPIVEQRLGNKKFLFLYLAAGIFANLFAWLFGYSFYELGLSMTDPERVRALGASGAVFGIIGAFGMLFPNMEVMLLIPPMPIKGKYLAIGLIVFGLFMDFGGNTGHLAHIGGAIFGYLIVNYWKKKYLI